MSVKQLAEIRCPSCNCEANFTVWKNINTGMDHDLAEKARSGEVFRFVCPECGKISMIEFDMFYDQPDGKLMIYLASSDASYKEACKRLVGDRFSAKSDALGEYTVRVVNSQADFMEKLCIFDNGLDDRTIEIVKLIMATKFRREHSDVKFNSFIFGKKDNGFGFTVIADKKPTGFIPVDMDFYNRVHGDYSVHYKKDKRSNLAIDLLWAINLTKEADDF